MTRYGFFPTPADLKERIFCPIQDAYSQWFQEGIRKMFTKMSMTTFLKFAMKTFIIAEILVEYKFLNLYNNHTHKPFSVPIDNLN